MRKLCLHAVRLAHPDQFTAQIAALTGTRAVQGRMQEKTCGDGLSARYHRYKLIWPAGGEAEHRYTVQTLEGVMLIRNEMITLYDVVFQYGPGGEEAVRDLVQRLLAGADEYVLAEPDLKRRLAAMAGRPYPRLPRGSSRDEAVRHYLPWQLYGISWFWYLVLNDRLHRQLVRQLRVKLRRLRSCFVFFKEGLPTDKVQEWKRYFRSEAETLSAMRELDVVLQQCQMIQDQTGRDMGRLTGVFTKLREEAAGDFYRDNRLNDHTLRLAGFYLWTDTALDWNRSREKASVYAWRRLGTWVEKLAELRKKYPDFRNMEDLHKMRIKVKRIRYVLQTVDVLRLPPSLVRQLKQVQDTLGFLHDDYVNDNWMDAARRLHPDDAALERQIQAFCEAQEGRVERSLEQVPVLWEDFLASLRDVLARHDGSGSRRRS